MCLNWHFSFITLIYFDISHFSVISIPKIMWMLQIKVCSTVFTGQEFHEIVKMDLC